jgi:hypothetical protein
VSSAWPLVAALLRGERSVSGIRFCAVGSGADAWDTARPPTPDSTRLVREVTRVPIAPADIQYVDATGTVATTPTHRLELEVTVMASQGPLRLREFALFGGESATSAPDSGRMINYVIHPRIDLAAGKSLTRTIRLSFRPAGGGRAAQSVDLLDIPLHWLANEPTKTVDGVGTKMQGLLREIGVTTVGDLARLTQERRPAEFSPARAIELRGKARLALRTAAQIMKVKELETLTLRDIVMAEPDELPGAVGPSTIELLLEQLALLQLSLDAAFLTHTTLGDLTRSG